MIDSETFAVNCEQLRLTDTRFGAPNSHYVQHRVRGFGLSSGERACASGYFGPVRRPSAGRETAPWQAASGPASVGIPSRCTITFTVAEPMPAMNGWVSNLMVASPSYPLK